MNQQIKELRTYQIAAISILKNLPGCEVKQVESPLFDFLVTIKDTSLVFGVEVKNSGFVRTNHFQRYLQSLEDIDTKDRANRIPVLLAAVNEEEESVRIGFLIAWQFGRAKIYRKPAMMELNASNAEKILDCVKSMDETIRILSLHGMKVIKRIRMEQQRADGFVAHGTVVYLRDFTQEYKMHQKEVVNERESIERLLHGTPQDEYPEDDLDRAIFEMIQQQFPDATRVSKLMLFSTDLRNLQILSRSYHRRIDMAINPAIDINNPTIARLMSVIKTINFHVDVFIEARWDVDLFEGLHFETSRPLEGWNNTYQTLSKAITTMSNPVEFFMEE